QALDTTGAFIGPLLAVLLMFALANDVRAVLWVAVIPAILSVAILWIAVREPPRSAAAAQRMPRLRPRDLPRAFWIVSLVAACFTLARFSEAFLILRGADVGLALAWTPLVLVVMNVAYMGSACPIGRLADRVPRMGLLAL